MASAARCDCLDSGHNDYCRIRHVRYEYEYSYNVADEVMPHVRVLIRIERNILSVFAQAVP
eukprot:scaffold301265_cov19-Prasinocladus_malaysianus.AAC.1